EALVPRIEGHFSGDPEGYRDPEDRERARERDPLPRLRDRLVEDGVLTAEDIELLEKEIETELDDGVEFAKSSPMP
ncbi:MAG: ABC transporter substrate-binding protein, partial [Actinobacteria bacterium]|nr:ABC transporter substrate-binding protein [Actinomycetota bacterium]NIU20449.1 ABC transporter substrate-binding protein [Actinomycetota bacterium]NIU76694.1 ABC transporter substrate-binding protein [Gammaproteobacteria bacterium]